mmetsp:Transcript_15274/g.22385  ORF Transcript_15274/g.22385 Transcript_15274/m.22385 type:complete len:87 (-) Transcript_15274:301-561(-)
MYDTVEDLVICLIKRKKLRCTPVKNAVVNAILLTPFSNELFICRVANVCNSDANRRIVPFCISDGHILFPRNTDTTFTLPNVCLDL